MFPRRFFPGRYFAPRYFPQSQGEAAASGAGFLLLLGAGRVLPWILLLNSLR